MTAKKTHLLALSLVFSLLCGAQAAHGFGGRNVLLIGCVALHTAKYSAIAAAFPEQTGRALATTRRAISLWRWGTNHLDEMMRKEPSGWLGSFIPKRIDRTKRAYWDAVKNPPAPKTFWNNTYWAE